MFNRKPPENTRLEKVIDVLLDRMADYDADDAEYPKMLEQLIKLYKLKEIDSQKRVSPDTLILVAGNLVGIVLILGYEKANVITSRAIGFVMKLR